MTPIRFEFKVQQINLVTIREYFDQGLYGILGNPISKSSWDIFFETVPLF